MPSKGKSKAQKKAVVQTAPPQKEAAASGSASDFPAEATLDEDLTSSASRVATECSAVIKTFVQGARYLCIVMLAVGLRNCQGDAFTELSLL